MRTTINVPDDLLAQLKRLAATSHTTVTALIEDALRDALARRRHRRHNGPLHLPTYGKEGLQPGVDLDDTGTLLDVMEFPGGSAGR